MKIGAFVFMLFVVKNLVFYPVIANKILIYFTTKPTGQGLGLSISYDIIVQQHRGEIKVETEEGKFTEFVVRLPRAESIAQRAWR